MTRPVSSGEPATSAPALSGDFRFASRGARAEAARGHFHDAGFYASAAEFLQLVVPFVVEGIAAGEPVVLGYDKRKSELLRAALPAPDGVVLLADRSLYATPAGAIEAYRRQIDQHLAAGAARIRIAGDVPHGDDGGRFAAAGWDRYEAAISTAWGNRPVWSRCLDDAATDGFTVRLCSVP